MDNNNYNSLHKCELAEKLGIHVSTLSIWLNKRYFRELSRLGYKKNQKILLPSQVSFLCEKLVVVDDNE